jgi:hypothetical protein
MRLPQVMNELEFVKAQPARLPTRRDQAFVPLKIMFGSAVIGAALVILWLDAFLRHSHSGLDAGAVSRPSWPPCC